MIESFNNFSIKILIKNNKFKNSYNNNKSDKIIKLSLKYQKLLKIKKFKKINFKIIDFFKLEI